MAYVPVKPPDETQLQELQDKHEDILQMSGGDRAPWVVVVRRPTRQETIGYKAHAKRDETTANEQLIRKITVYPAGEDAEKQIQRWPFLCDGLVDNSTFKQFLGLAVEVQEK